MLLKLLFKTYILLAKNKFYCYLVENNNNNNNKETNLANLAKGRENMRYTNVLNIIK